MLRSFSPACRSQSTGVRLSASVADTFPTKRSLCHRILFFNKTMSVRGTALGDKVLSIQVCRPEFRSSEHT